MPKVEKKEEKFQLELPAKMVKSMGDMKDVFQSASNQAYSELISAMKAAILPKLTEYRSMVLQKIKDDFGQRGVEKATEQMDEWVMAMMEAVLETGGEDLLSVVEEKKEESTQEATASVVAYLMRQAHTAKKKGKTALAATLRAEAEEILQNEMEDSSYAEDDEEELAATFAEAEEIEDISISEEEMEDLDPPAKTSVAQVVRRLRKIGNAKLADKVESQLNVAASVGGRPDIVGVRKFLPALQVLAPAELPVLDVSSKVSKDGTYEFIVAFNHLAIRELAKSEELEESLADFTHVFRKFLKKNALLEKAPRCTAEAMPDGCCYKFICKPL